MLRVRYIVVLLYKLILNCSYWLIQAFQLMFYSNGTDANYFFNNWLLAQKFIAIKKICQNPKKKGA